MTKAQANRLFKVIFGLLKTICILAGLPISVICLMSAAGFVSGNGWIRLGVGLIFGIGVPIFLADRLLPENSQQRSRGLVTDILALCWLGLPFLFVGVGHQWTRGLLLTEGNRQSAAGLAQIAKVTYTMAYVNPVPTAVGHGARTDLRPPGRRPRPRRPLRRRTPRRPPPRTQGPPRARTPRARTAPAPPGNTRQRSSSPGSRPPWSTSRSSTDPWAWAAAPAF